MLVSYKVRKLKESDALDVIKLYASSCKNLKYFQDYFGKQDCEEDITKNFAPDVIAALRTGLCVGCYYKKELVGIILSIDWNRYLEQEKALFDHMFNTELDETKELIDYMSQLNHAYFIFAMGTKDGYRCQGIATRMLYHYLVLARKRSAIITDCVYEHAQSLWWSNHFTSVELHNMSLAVKTPC